ncbi:MAG: fumarylacetoacetate hydrolase family protein [Flavobacteriaceae bacterium]|nr:fumarylacetoacetate hydrolase family protein [Flavobacteriaceae bacterium]
MKIVCVGRNYAAHIEELQNEKPKHPVLFLKPDTTILQKNQPFFIPHFSNDIHYEVEVLVKIQRLGKHIQPEFAHKYYSQIGLGIDFTARSVQNELKEKGLPWEKAKAFDGSTLIGEWYNKNTFESLEDISFSLEKNGEKVQLGNTSNMLWKIDELIAYCSQYFTLKIGDVLFTGTPSGVGAVSLGDHLVGYLEGQQAFSVKIK